MALVHDLASERRDLQRSMDKAVNQMMALAQQLKVEGVEGVAGQVREQRELMRQKAPADRS